MDISNKTKADIRAHAEKQYPHESCGLVVVSEGREIYIPCANEAALHGAPSSLSHFAISPESYAEAEERGDIVGIVHSHPDAPATPSEADRTMCEVSELPWHIVEVRCDEDDIPKATNIVSFAPNGFKAPLIGRQFVHGVNDCYTLIRDWYKEERGVTLKDWRRTDEWWEKGENLYADHYSETGFKQLSDDEDLQIGDVIIMMVRSKVPNHGAIYVGDSMILQHLYGRISGRTIYGGYWQHVTVLRLRYVGNE